MTKRLLLIFLFAASGALAQTTVVGLGTGTGGASVLTCAGAPGATTALYKQQCQVVPTGALWDCNNAAGCTLAADWAAVGVAGSGTVTSFSVTSLPSIFNSAVANPTAAAALTVTMATGQTPHLVFGTCGSATAFGACSLVPGDLPTIPYSQLSGTPTIPTVTGGPCTNQAVTAISSSAVPTCSTVTSAYVDTSIAKTGTDINTTNQVTATHLAAPLPVLQGGTGTTTPALVAGTNVTLSGVWPNQTINATAGGGGVSSVSGDGAIITNSNSVGAVTLALGTAGAHKYLGNPTASTAAPAYSSIVSADLPAALASQTSINGLAISPSTGTIAIANAKTLTASNTLTLTGTDASSVAFGGGGTVLYNGGALGTPSSGIGTNLTGLPLSTAVIGTLQAGQEPAHTGDMQNSAGSLATLVRQMHDTVTSVNNAASPYTILAADNFIACDATAGAVVLNLPATSGGGRELSLKKIDSTANACTLTRAGSDVIDGATTAALTVQYAAAKVVDRATGTWDRSHVNQLGGDLAGASTAGTVAKVNGNTPGGNCTNQAVTSLNSSAVPTCTTLTSAYVNNTIALTGTDINTTNQVTATHLASALPVNQGGSGTTTPAIVAGTNITVSGTWPNQTINATAGGSGTVTSFSVAALPSIFSSSVATSTVTPALTVTAATGQTAHQVYGTCGTATTYGPCTLVAGDLPIIPLLTGVSGKWVDSGMHFLHGYPAYTGSSLTSAAAGANGGRVISFTEESPGRQFAYIGVGFGSGLTSGQGFSIAIYNYGMTSVLCSTTAITGGNVTGNGPKFLAVAAGSVYSAGLCTLPPGGYKAVMTSDASTSVVRAYQEDPTEFFGSTVTDCATATTGISTGTAGTLAFVANISAVTFTACVSGATLPVLFFR